MNERLWFLRRALGIVCAALLLALATAAWVGPTRVEQAIRFRLQVEAAQRGLSAHVDAVHLGLWPPLALSGLRVEKPGVWALDVDSVGVTLRVWGTGLLGRTRLALGRVSLRMPEQLGLEIGPTLWDVVAVPQGGFRTELRRPEADRRPQVRRPQRPYHRCGEDHIPHPIRPYDEYLRRISHELTSRSP